MKTKRLFKRRTKTRTRQLRKRKSVKRKNRTKCIGGQISFTTDSTATIGNRIGKFGQAVKGIAGTTVGAVT